MSKPLCSTAVTRAVQVAENFFYRLGLRNWEPPTVHPPGRSISISGYERQVPERPEIYLSKDWRNDIYHEYGHHIVSQYDLTHKSIYKKHFPKDWPVFYMLRVRVFLKLSYIALDYGIRPPAGKVSWYACVCDEEDFCECVDALINEGGVSNQHIKSIAEGDSLLEKKLKAVRGILKSCARR